MSNTDKVWVDRFLDLRNFVDEMGHMVIPVSLVTNKIDEILKEVRS